MIMLIEDDLEGEEDNDYDKKDGENNNNNIIKTVGNKRIISIQIAENMWSVYTYKKDTNDLISHALMPNNPNIN